ncbi:hypothetical protein [Dactylosporangium sp. NPDC049140]|uniref:hypothetical protein n=1 Tax=Dactylosporangium sp. NPDC049140 TaxID=3155647 RepID=UPI00340844CD
MTYDLAVWEGDRPDDTDAGEVFSALYDRYIAGGYSPPTPAISAYVEALLDRWYEMGDPRDVDDTSPWSSAPLIDNASGPIIYFAMRYSMADEVSAACAHMAAERGLVCFDVQWDQLRPGADET